ncbi:MAG: YdcF family protein, partial [Deltaproteobacteria bacterium]|nr:YdcF family protein [Deltaproteobacteria bacterium]
KDKCLKLRKEVHLFPFGYDEELYASIRVDENLKPPVEFNNIPHPRAVYLGGLHKHVDQDLILKCAEKFPNVSFILIGPRQESFDAMESFSNIYMLGKKLKEEVPSYLKFCDIALIPYVRSHYTDCVYPTKMNEYLAMNLPIISTDIPEVVRYQSETGAPIQTAASHQSFVQCLGDLVKKIDKKEIRGIEHAHKQSWSYKISKMQELIQHVLDDKLNSNMAPWQQRFKKMFIKKKLQFYYGITGLLMGYLILFHTPLMWFVAQPLFFQSQNLIPSDVAVVLGGGVGETGEVAQGYQERVAMGVQLYHDQLASHLIFASGYRYEFYEAYVMKQLAMSQGVPENKILIESDGSNTYETLKRVSKLIQDNLMKTVIIVSSPYHLRRAQLVAHKIFPKNLSVSFKPLDKSYFFGSLNSKPKWIQMKAIAHEYIAILYYRLKSYI